MSSVLTRERREHKARLEQTFNTASMPADLRRSMYITALWIALDTAAGMPAAPQSEKQRVRLAYEKIATIARAVARTCGVKSSMDWWPIVQQQRARRRPSRSLCQ